MSLDFELADRVLTLPLSERVELLRRLVDSLDGEGEVDALWQAEIRERAERFERGETPAGDAYEALERITRKVTGGEVR